MLHEVSTQGTKMAPGDMNSDEFDDFSTAEGSVKAGSYNNDRITFYTQ